MINKDKDNLALQQRQAKTGTIIALIGTILPVLGLFRQLVDPTGDKIVIIVLGSIVILFFILAMVLLYSIKQITMDEKRATWSKYQKTLGIIFLFYPFAGFLASIYLIKAGNTGLEALNTDTPEA